MTVRDADYVTIAEAAKLAKRSRTWVLDLIQSDQLVTYMRGSPKIIHVNRMALQFLVSRSDQKRGSPKGDAPHVWDPGERQVTITIPDAIFSKAVNAEIADVLAHMKSEAQALLFTDDDKGRLRADIDVDFDLGDDASVQFRLADILIDRLGDETPGEPGYALCADLLAVLGKHGLLTEDDALNMRVRSAERREGVQ